MRAALEQQKATAEILRVMASSPADVQPVLDAIAETAAHICGATDAHIYRVAGDLLQQAAHFGPIPGLRPGESLPLSRGSVSGRSILDRQPIHMRDAVAELDEAEYPVSYALQRRWGYRSLLVTPLLRHGEAIGAIAVRRMEVDPFTTQQIGLLKTFADQAAIAIENVRLFNETKEALERQTATADVLRAISGSPTELQPVLDAIAANASRFCRAEDVAVALVDDHRLRLRAHVGAIRQPLLDWTLDRDTVTGRAVLEGRTIQLEDLQSADAEFPVSARAAREAGHRTILATPLVREGRAVGCIFLRRPEIRRFTSVEIDLVETFAAQAVIAIENVRLFNETKDALERQTALGEILRVIAASPSDLTPALDAIAHSAARFGAAENVTVMIVEEDGLLHPRANFGPLTVGTAPFAPDRTTVTGRSIVEARTIQVPDLQAAADEFPAGRALALALGHRTTMAAPMIRHGRAIGALVLRRAEVRPFTDKQVELVKVFADQAVIAIENVRLINEIREKSAELEVANDELAAASQHKSEFLANMSHELRTPLNAIIGFSDVLEQRLFGELNERQAEYTHDIASSGRHLLDLVNEILDLSKVEAGRMALEPSAFALAETIRGTLAFIRERAAGHRIALGAEIPADLGTVVADERKVRQVLLNLLSNAVKFTPDGGTINVRARRADGEVQVSVQDTGIGIAPEDQATVFEEFQQVGTASDRSREGTGLGLTLAKRFVELHGGRIWVESEIGTGTMFTFAIPVGPPVAPA